MIKSVNAIVTHSGAFHADEIAAIALLKRYFFPLEERKCHHDDLAMPVFNDGEKTPEDVSLDLMLSEVNYDFSEQNAIPLIRTRNPDLLAIARSNPTVMVLDVGADFDSNLLNFDHHQDSMRETWPDGTPFSSAGLVWRWLRSKGILDESLGVELADVIERELIRPLDKQDNGIEIFEPAMVLDLYNRSGLQSTQFKKASQFLEDYMDNKIYHLSEDLTCELELRKAWSLRQNNSRYVLLNEKLPGNRATELLKKVSADEALLMISPRSVEKGIYSLTSTSKEEMFSVKCPFPEEWCGHNNLMVNIKGQNIHLDFVHKNGFIGIVRGGPEAAKLVADHVIEHNLALGVVQPLPPAYKTELKKGP